MPGSCEVCSSEPSKYRCPTCELMSCSLACTQSHKIYCAPKPAATNGGPNEPSADTHQLTNGIGAQDTAGNLENKTDPSCPAFIPALPELKELLQRHPGLRDQLYEIYRSTQEEEWVEWYSPHTRGRANGRGGKGPPRRSRGPWTAEKGFNRGLGRVRKLRQDCDAGTETGATAEAFMQFLALVNHSQPPAQLPEVS